MATNTYLIMKQYGYFYHFILIVLNWNFNFNLKITFYKLAVELTRYCFDLQLKSLKYFLKILIYIFSIYYIEVT